MAENFDHFIVRVGQATGGHWDSGRLNRVWGFRSRANSLARLTTSVGLGRAVVWFLTNRQPNNYPMAGRIVAVARPAELRPRRADDLTDAQLGWNDDGVDYVNRLVMGHDFFDLPIDRPLMSSRELQEINNDRPLLQNSIQFVDPTNNNALCVHLRQHYDDIFQVE